MPAAAAIRSRRHAQFLECRCPQCGGPRARDRHLRHLHGVELVLRALHLAGATAPWSTSARTTGCRSTSTSAASSTRSCTCCIPASTTSSCATRAWCSDEPANNLLTQGMVMAEIYPQAGRRTQRGLQSGRRRRGARRARRTHRRDAARRRPAGGDRRHREDVEVEEQRRRSAGDGRRSTAPTPCACSRCSPRRRSSRWSGRTRASKGMARFLRRFWQRCTRTSRAGRRAGSIRRRSTPRRRPAPAAARDHPEGRRRQRPPPQLQHRDRRADGTAQPLREVRR